MKSARLIKRGEPPPAPLKPIERATLPAQGAQALRTVVMEWMQEHKAARSINPRKEFAALFTSAQTISTI
jgi:hypothetical protein